MGNSVGKRRYKDAGRAGNPGWFAPAPVTSGPGGQQGRISDDPWAANPTPSRFTLDDTAPTAAPAPTPRKGLRAALRGAVDGFTTGLRRQPQMNTWDTPPAWQAQAAGPYPATPPLYASEAPAAPVPTGLPTRIPTGVTPLAPVPSTPHIQQPTSVSELRNMNGSRGRAWRINEDGSTTLLGNDFHLRMDSGQFGAPEQWRGRQHVALIDKFGNERRLDYSEVVFQATPRTLAA